MVNIRGHLYGNTGWVHLCIVTFTISQSLSEKLHPLSDDFIRDINQKQSLWVAGRNFHKNTSLERLIQKSGVILNTNTSRSLRMKRDIGNITAQSIPNSFDARLKWNNCPSIRRINDQANCGGCWAVAAAEVMSDRICIHSNGKKKPVVSGLDILSCCTGCGIGCKGGEPKLAFDYWIDFGVVSGGRYASREGCKSYFLPPCSHHMAGSKPDCGANTQAPKCNKICDENTNLIYSEELTFGTDVYTVEKNEESIKREIMDNGPVVATFHVYTDFWNYKQGIYTHVSGQSAGVHAVRIIGWGAENSISYWLVANTWNEEWGDSGFFKIIRGRNECGIESSIVTGLPQS